MNEDQKETIEMARMAGLPIDRLHPQKLCNFAALIAGAEREACAKFVEDFYGEPNIATGIMGREIVMEPDPLDALVPPPDTLEYEIYRHKNKTRWD